MRHANAMLERGIEHHPDDWRNRFYLGFNHFFYLGENAEAAAAPRARGRRFPGAPRYLGRLVARLRSQARGGDLAAASAFLRELLRQSPGPAARRPSTRRRSTRSRPSAARACSTPRARSSRRATAATSSRSRSWFVCRRPCCAPLPPEPHGSDWKLDPRKRRDRLAPGSDTATRCRIDGTNRMLLERFRARSRSTEEGM